MHRFLLVSVFMLCNLLSLSYPLFGQELKPSEPKAKEQRLPGWAKDIVFETHAYEWFTDGNIISKETDLEDDTGEEDETTTGRFDTDANLYVVGGELGYRFDLPFLQRITGGVEIAQGDSKSMHGRLAEVDDEEGEFNPIAISGKWDDSRYFKASLFLRPFEGGIVKDVTGFFDVGGEWIRYKDRVAYAFEDSPTGKLGNAFDKYRYEGGGMGFRGGFWFFDMLSLKGQFTWYPGLSVKGSRNVYYSGEDAGDSDYDSLYGSDGEGKSFRVAIGFSPFKERKNLEIECGYQYMEFKQDGGQTRSAEFNVNGVVDNIQSGIWKRASNYRDGFFAGGTIRW